MAQYTHTKAVQQLIDAGLPAEQIQEECPALDLHIWRDGTIDAYTWNRAEQGAFLAYHEERLASLKQDAPEAPQSAPAAHNEPKATQRQIAFIMRLITDGRHQEGGFYAGPTDRDKIAAMSRRDASMYIDSLLGNY